jgi:hypothetical protein
MVRRNFGENFNSKTGEKQVDDSTTIDPAGGSSGIHSTIERINKIEKILALVNSPHEGEAVSAARMAMKLSRAWGIDLGLSRSPSGERVGTPADKVVYSGCGYSSSAHSVPTDQVNECFDPETRRRTIPTFVKAHLRRRGGGPPFPVRPHRRRRRTMIAPPA